MCFSVQQYNTINLKYTKVKIKVSNAFYNLGHVYEIPTVCEILFSLLGISENNISHLTPICFLPYFQGSDMRYIRMQRMQKIHKAQNSMKVF